MMIFLIIIIIHYDIDDYHYIMIFILTILLIIKMTNIKLISRLSLIYILIYNLYFMIL